MCSHVSEKIRNSYKAVERTRFDERCRQAPAVEQVAHRSKRAESLRNGIVCRQSEQTAVVHVDATNEGSSVVTACTEGVGRLEREFFYWENLKRCVEHHMRAVGGAEIAFCIIAAFGADTCITSEVIAYVSAEIPAFRSLSVENERKKSRAGCVRSAKREGVHRQIVHISVSGKGSDAEIIEQMRVESDAAAQLGERAR